MGQRRRQPSHYACWMRALHTPAPQMDVETICHRSALLVCVDSLTRAQVCVSGRTRQTRRRRRCVCMHSSATVNYRASLSEVGWLVLVGWFKIKTFTPAQKGAVRLILSLPPRFQFSPETALTEKQAEVLCSCAVRQWHQRFQGFRGLTPTEAGAVKVRCHGAERCSG